MNIAIYMCTKFAVRFVYVDTNNSVHSWQILYMNHILWYVNGNADNQNLLIAVTHELKGLILIRSAIWSCSTEMPKSTTGFSHAPLETAFTLHRRNTVWPPWLFQLPVIIALNFTCSKVILSADFYRRNTVDPPAWVKPPWDTKI